jgi:nucleotide-binding universal stress UspA family protein
MLKLLVPVGHSTRALQAVRHAAFLYAERCVSEVVLMNVQPPLEATRLEAFHPLPQLRAIESAAARADLAHARRILEEVGVTYSVVWRTGPLISTIVDCAEQRRCDEIVITAPERGLFQRATGIFRRSVFDRLARVSSVPVTAVT